MTRDDHTMAAVPSLTTARLLLRPFHLSDAPNIQQLAGAEEVAAGTFFPHPYEDGMAEQWIVDQEQAHESGTAVSFAITLADHATFIGSISLDIVSIHQHARLGYWLGVPYWNHGYGTEAVGAVLHYGFMQLNLHRIYSPHFQGNAASGRVLQKVGMTYEGRMREHYVRFGRPVDLELYGMLKREFMERT
ncbi:putative N-acetyltransferase, GCN5-related [Nitrospira lenta]|uniref:Putative N-acetyltransferase, GCN5-related n=2 Tax=Nitrospira lenta TaxID=1436998 RepID=A0A330L334_9BACT|nr:putative N-acetyltransferase, GCN5-related [Nitrospira lenta]